MDKHSREGTTDKSKKSTQAVIFSFWLQSCLPKCFLETSGSPKKVSDADNLCLKLPNVLHLQLPFVPGAALGTLELEMLPAQPWGARPGIKNWGNTKIKTSHRKTLEEISASIQWLMTFPDIYLAASAVISMCPGVRHLPSYSLQGF